MTQPIKITEADIDHIGNMCGSSEIWLNEETVRKILAAAIERGLVSPPVYVERGFSGRLLSSNGQPWLQHKGNEHWKGQME